MYRIKRVKTAQPGPDGMRPPATTCYAVSVAPAGNITGFTADSTKAGLFSDDLMARVKAHYSSRPQAGKFEYLKEPEPLPEVKAVEPVKVDPPTLPVTPEAAAKPEAKPEPKIEKLKAPGRK